MAEDGSKMSKSVGNVIAPMPVIEKYGSDALRMGIISGRTAAVNRGYDVRRVEEARNFCNKLWNVARYIEGVIGDQPDRTEVKPVTIADHWILDKIRTAVGKICRELDEYGFSEAYETLYHFVWDDLADWYVEASKTEPNKPLLAYLLEQVLVLAHPFAPFVTETIWQTLAWEQDSLLAARQITEVISSDNGAAADFTELQNIVTEARYIVRALKVANATLYYTEAPFLADNATTIARLAGLQAVTQVRDGSGLYLTSTKQNCWLDIDAATARAYLKELEGKQTRQTEVIQQLEGRLANKAYVKQAPKAVVEQTKQQLKEARELLESLGNEVNRFS
jgi:valyl-tRNA synthetase